MTPMNNNTMSKFVSSFRTESNAISSDRLKTRLKPKVSSSILRELSQRKAVSVNSSPASKSVKRESQRIFWDYNVKTFQSFKGSVFVKDEVFNQNELDAEYSETEEVGWDKGNSRRQQSLFAENEDVPKQVSRLHSLDSFGFSLDESGIFDHYDDSEINEDVHVSNVKQNSYRRGSIVSNMRRDLGVFGSFGSDNRPDAAKKRPSLRNRATTAVAAIKSRNQPRRDPGNKHSGKECANDTHRHLERKGDHANKRESRIGVFIFFNTKSKSDTHPSKTEEAPVTKRKSMENIVESIKLLARNTADRGKEQSDVKRTASRSRAHSSKPARRPRKTLFNTVAAEKFDAYGDFLAQVPASSATTFRSDQEDGGIKSSRKGHHFEKIRSILYMKE